MKTIRLAPAKHEPPFCDAYDDEDEVRGFERAVRVHRAYTERFQIVPADDRADGAYRVTGSSGAAYHVDIVDRSGARDACSRADFLTNVRAHVARAHPPELGVRELWQRVRGS